MVGLFPSRFDLTLRILFVVSLVALLSFVSCVRDDFLIANHNSDNIMLMNGDTGNIKEFIRSGLGGLISPDTIIYHPFTGTILISSGTNTSNSAILMYDPQSGRFLGRFDDARGPLDRPYGMAFSPDGSTLFVSSFRNNQILKYDSKNGQYIGSLPATDLMNGPNALLFANDGHLYVTTEGSTVDGNGNVSWPYPSQILKLFNDNWVIFVDSADPFGKPNHIASSNFLGLANNPFNREEIWVSDYSNGIMVFSIETKKLIRRIETTYTGSPSRNAIGSIAFSTNSDPSNPIIFTPGFLPQENFIGSVLRFNATNGQPMPCFRCTGPLFVPPTPLLSKPIGITQFLTKPSW